MRILLLSCALSITLAHAMEPASQADNPLLQSLEAIDEPGITFNERHARTCTFWQMLGRASEATSKECQDTLIFVTDVHDKVKSGTLQTEDAAALASDSNAAYKRLAKRVAIDAKAIKAFEEKFGSFEALTLHNTVMIKVEESSTDELCNWKIMYEKFDNSFSGQTMPINKALAAVSLIIHSVRERRSGASILLALDAALTRRGLPLIGLDICWLDRTDPIVVFSTWPMEKQLRDLFERHYLSKNSSFTKQRNAHNARLRKEITDIMYPANIVTEKRCSIV